LPVLVEDPSTSLIINSTITDQPPEIYDDDRETIPFVNDVDVNELLDIEEFGDLYEPVTEESQEPATNTEEEQPLDQFLDDFLNDPNFSLDQFRRKHYIL